MLIRDPLEDVAKIKSYIELLPLGDDAVRPPELLFLLRKSG
jgi:hypothetical protein